MIAERENNLLVKSLEERPSQGSNTLYAHLPNPFPKIYFNQAFRISPVNYFARPHDEKVIANMKQ